MTSKEVHTPSWEPSFCGCINSRACFAQPETNQQKRKPKIQLLKTDNKILLISHSKSDHKHKSKRLRKSTRSLFRNSPAKKAEQRSTIAFSRSGFKLPCEHPNTRLALPGRLSEGHAPVTHTAEGVHAPNGVCHEASHQTSSNNEQRGSGQRSSCENHSRPNAKIEIRIFHLSQKVDKHGTPKKHGRREERLGAVLQKNYLETPPSCQFLV